MEHHLTTYITHDTLISALGFGTQENLEAIRSYHSGITLQTDKRIADTPLLAATLSQERLQQQAEAIGVSGYPRMEQLFILTINELIRQSGQTLEDKTCGLILSTTKGNIDLLARHTEHPDEAVFLWKMAENIAGYFHAEERVHVISNACISGVSALIAGKRMIENGIYRRVIVAGGDLLSHFITSGFGSFRSLSSRPCRPYDSSRDGLNLGEPAEPYCSVQKEQKNMLSFREEPSVTMPTTSPVLPARETDSISPSAKPCRKQEQPLRISVL